jgi:cell division septum initiation protein DivIVA
MGFDSLQLGRELERLQARLAELEIDAAQVGPLTDRLAALEASHSELAAASAADAASAAEAASEAAESAAEAAESAAELAEAESDEIVTPPPPPPGGESEPAREPEPEQRPRRIHWLHRRLWGEAS